MNSKNLAWAAVLVYALSISTGFAAPPPNDDISNAITILGPDAVISGTTVEATPDPAAAAVPLCGSAVTTPGVWYTVYGGGVQAMADTCASSNYDTKLHVFTMDGGGGLNCVTGNDDVCGLQSEVVWDGVLGEKYFILVSGFGGATGAFDLTLSGIGGVPETADIPTLSTWGLGILAVMLGLVGYRRRTAA
jgi:hypothetical protein